jgi:hypothetical protein
MKKMMLSSLMIMTLFIALQVQAEEPAQESEAQNEISVFGGVTHTSDDNKGTAGVDYERRLPFFNSSLGVGALVDSAIGSDTETLFAVPFFVHPYLGLELLVAPGFSISSDPTKFVFRSGAGYAIELSKSFAVVPNISFDVSKDPLATVYGLSIAFSF